MFSYQFPNCLSLAMLSPPWSATVSHLLMFINQRCIYQALPQYQQFPIMTFNSDYNVEYQLWIRVLMIVMTLLHLWIIVLLVHNSYHDNADYHRFTARPILINNDNYPYNAAYHFFLLQHNESCSCQQWQWHQLFTERVSSCSRRVASPKYRAVLFESASKSLIMAKMMIKHWWMMVNPNSRWYCLIHS